MLASGKISDVVSPLESKNSLANGIGLYDALAYFTSGRLGTAEICACSVSK